MRRLTVILCAAIALGLAACGEDDPASSPSADAPSGPPIRIGTKNFTEQYILGELYKQALESRGFRVQLKDDIGNSEITHQALRGGGIDMYPEYVGVLLSEIADVSERPKSPAAAYRLAERFEERSGFTLLKSTPFSDANALAVTREFARSNDVREIGDLDDVEGGTTIGAPPEFRTRFEGLVGLRRLYGLDDVQFEPRVIGAQYDALDDGAIDAAAVFTTDGRLAERDYLVLDDPERVFAEQHVAPVIREELLAAHGPRLAQTIDAVSGRLTTEVMREMNAAVDLRGEVPRAVADRFLRAEGLTR